MAHLPVGQVPVDLGAAVRSFAFRTVASDGATASIDRTLAIEAPIAIEIDGIGYAVMMATPDAFDDFAVGFCLAERLVDHGDEVRSIDAHPVDRGMLLRLTLDPAVAGRVRDRVRHRASDSSCGLCGIENLEQALRPLPPVSASCLAGSADVFRSLSRLRDHQPLGRLTGAVHAAAACAADGAIRLLREDVGRHNAVDKLIGAMARAGSDWAGGFLLVTARLSYELVEKAALAGCPAIAAISAPTSLAIERAAEAGIHIFALARPDALLEALPPSR